VWDKNDPVSFQHSAFPVPWSNMVLASVAYPAASVPRSARVALQTVESTALTPNTDFSVEASRDGGTSWSAATLALTMSLNGVKMYEGVASLSGQPPAFR
jgi:hypothetical protein